MEIDFDGEDYRDIVGYLEDLKKTEPGSRICYKGVGYSPETLLNEILGKTDVGIEFTKKMIEDLNDR